MTKNVQSSLTHQTKLHLEPWGELIPSHVTLLPTSLNHCPHLLVLLFINLFPPLLTTSSLSRDPSINVFPYE